MNRNNEPSQREQPATAKKINMRFRIVKLEERVAPGGTHGNGSNLTCGNFATCQHCGTNQNCASGYPTDSCGSVF